MFQCVIDKARWWFRDQHGTLSRYCKCKCIVFNSISTWYIAQLAGLQLLSRFMHENLFLQEWRHRKTLRSLLWVENEIQISIRKHVCHDQESVCSMKEFAISNCLHYLVYLLLVFATFLIQLPIIKAMTIATFTTSSYTITCSLAKQRTKSKRISENFTQFKAIINETDIMCNCLFEIYSRITVRWTDRWFKQSYVSNHMFCTCLRTDVFSEAKSEDNCFLSLRSTKGIHKQ